MIPLLWRYLFTLSSYKHCNSPTILLLYIRIMFPLFRRKLLTILCYIRCSRTTMIILYIWFMIPLFWGNNTIFSKSHSYCPVTRSNIRIMIIFFIRYFSFIICLYKCHSTVYTILTFLFFRILILFILPFFWHHNTIIP